MKVCIVCGKFCIIDWKIFINLLESLYSLWDSMCTLLESNRWLKNHCCQWSIWQCGAIGFGWFWDGLLGQLGLKLILFVSFLINFGLKYSKNQIKSNFLVEEQMIFIKHGFLVLSYKCKQDRHWKLEIRAWP